MSNFIRIGVLLFFTHTVFAIDYHKGLSGFSTDINFNANYSPNNASSVFGISTLNSVGYRINNYLFAIAIGVNTSPLYQELDKRFSYLNFGPQFKKYFSISDIFYFKMGPTIGLSSFEKNFSDPKKNYRKLGYLFLWENDFGMILNADTANDFLYSLELKTGLSYNDLFNSSATSYSLLSLHIGITFNILMDFTSTFNILRRK